MPLPLAAPWLVGLIGGKVLWGFLIAAIAALLTPVLFFLMAGLSAYLLLSTEWGMGLVRDGVAEIVGFFVYVFDNFFDAGATSLPSASGLHDSFAVKTLHLLDVFRIFDGMQALLLIFLVAFGFWIFRKIIGWLF